MSPASARTLRLLATLAFAGVMTARALGVAFSPWLLVNAPWGLLLLSPFFAHLILLAGVLDVGTYAAVGLAATVGHGAVGYAFGRVARERAQGWLATGASSSRWSGTLGRLAGWIRGASGAVLVLFPGPVTSALAGVAGTGPRAFFPLMVATQVAWLWGCAVLGQRLADHLIAARSFVAQHVGVLTAVTVVGVVARELVKRWPRRRA